MMADEQQGPEQLPNLRIITIAVTPGEDVEVNYEGFAHWEAEAALYRAAMLVHDAEEGIIFTADPNFEPGEEDD